MKTRYMLFMAAVLILFISCVRDKGVLYPEWGDRNLSITTDRTVYVWPAGEKQKHIVIQGELENGTGTTCHARVGDRMGAAGLLLFAENSAGTLEAFDPKDEVWRACDLLGMLIEGSVYIEIEPDSVYRFNATLYAHPDCYRTQTGLHRLKLEYAASENQDAISDGLLDYSNVFEIRAE